MAEAGECGGESSSSRRGERSGVASRDLALLYVDRAEEDAAGLRVLRAVSATTLERRDDVGEKEGERVWAGEGGADAERWPSAWTKTCERVFGESDASDWTMRWKSRRRGEVSGCTETRKHKAESLTQLRVR
jgi:hypothetical protein